jgi:hypothetical protein
VKTFVEAIRKVHDGTICPYVNTHKNWLGKVDGYGCEIEEGHLILFNTHADEPCTPEDFNTCPLFPHGVNK